MRLQNHPERPVGPCFLANGSRFARLSIAATALLPALAHAEYAVNLPPPASGLAREIYDLHTLVVWICVAIFVVVFIPMAISLVRHRKSTGHQAAKFHDNLRLEVIWTIIPVLILVGMAWPATSLIVSMKDTSKEDLTIKVTGRQWKWEYEYLGDDIRFMSNASTPQAQIDGTQPKGEHYLLEVDRPLVVPTGQKVRLVLTAADVIHTWWVPAFGVKQDARSWLHPRCLVQGRAAGNLPWAMRRTVRDWPRLHAGCG